MPIIIPANSAVSGGFNAANSLMFNSADSPYLSFTPGSTGNQRTFTFSFWVKRSKLGLGGTGQVIYGQSYSSDGYQFKIEFTSNDEFRLYNSKGASDAINLKTNRRFRDTSAWYAITIAIDTTQGTAANRAKIYVNGVQETSFGTATYPTQNLDMDANAAAAQIIGARYSGSYNTYFDGYMAEFVFIDGSALAPTDVGEFEEDSVIWQPIDVSGLTFGSNGYYLDFEDSSALGNDAAGSNNFSLNNIAATDQMIDTCTNNFCVLNTLDKNSNITLANGNLEYIATDGWYNLRGSFFVSSGKWYWEMKKTTSTSTYTFIGAATSEPALDFGYGGAQNGLFAYSASDGNKIGQGTASTSYGASFATGDIMGIALDMDGGTITFYKNGSTQGQAFSGITGDIAPWITGYSNKNEYNFGSPPYAVSSGNADANGFGNFEYAPPSGYFALCTKNLAEYG